MEKAIEIKRRAQRCILNGDLDGALSEYEKLIATGDSDPYHSVLLADLHYKKGNREVASRRYLEAIDGYQRQTLYKNAIAVCKKMSRLSLAPELVLERLGSLHALDGLATESTLYFMQHAELLMQRKEMARAIESLRRAFEVCPDNVRALERLAEAQTEVDSVEEAAKTLLDAAGNYERLGQIIDAKRCRMRAFKLAPELEHQERAPAPAAAAEPIVVADAAATAPVGDAVEAPPAAADSASAAPADDADSGADTSLLIESVADTFASRIVVDAPADAQRNGTEPHSATAEPAETLAPAEDATPVPDARAVGPADPYSGGRPSLVFDAPAAEASTSPLAGAPGLPEISALLNEAQALFDSGARDAAGASLVRAAQAYDRLGRFDSAASIYRSLSRVNEAPLQVMMLWLKNCQRRDDRAEAAQVACELGDRALMDGDTPGARAWFERARGFDPANDLAARRLERLTDAGGAGHSPVAVEAPPAPLASPAAPVAAAEVAMPAPEVSAAPDEASAVAGEASAAPAGTGRGKIEITVDLPATFGLELSELMAEFQRGLGDQLASDPQGHYDLAMSYREMGLLDEAIDSFQLAAVDPALRVRATEMMARCYLDRGEFDLAAEQFQNAIAMPELDPETLPDVLFQLGLALEVGGRMGEALEQFERVYAEQPNYSEVAQKIRALRKALERD